MAAAVLLIVDTFARNAEVIVSRNQLVEIGGAFRMPEVMAMSGAIMREVGTTNKTHLRDYDAAIGDNTGYLLGRKLGRGYFRGHSRFLFIKSEHIRKMDGYFARHGVRNLPISVLSGLSGKTL